jgi:pyruvate/2-oxoglutarate dehydrogenase complex dihydrolipoamide acyltransferase (E2) component
MRLLMPPYYRMIEGGTVVKWHKAEGDAVDYGDDLFDVRVEEVRITRTIKAPTAGQWLDLLAKEMKRQKAAPPPEEGGPAGEERPFKTWEAVVYVRVTSSDVGHLRRVHAREGDLRQVGELVAELTTEPAEPLEGAGGSPARAGTFRVVANLLENPSEGHDATDDGR